MDRKKHYAEHKAENLKLLMICGPDDAAAAAADGVRRRGFKSKALSPASSLSPVNRRGLFPGQLPVIAVTAFFAAYIFIGKEVLLTAAGNITKGKVFDENFLMTIASMGAFFIGEYPEAVAVMLFYRVGEYMQEKAVAKSRKSIFALMDIRPDTANKKTADGIQVVAAEDVRIGDMIVVKAGEKVPLDGIIEEGSSAMDTRALTGESLPRDVSIGSEVLSGSINGQGLLHIRVTKEFSESTASKIIELVQNAAVKRQRRRISSQICPLLYACRCGSCGSAGCGPAFALGMGGFSQGFTGLWFSL